MPGKPAPTLSVPMTLPAAKKAHARLVANLDRNPALAWSEGPPAATYVVATLRPLLFELHATRQADHAEILEVLASVGLPIGMPAYLQVLRSGVARPPRATRDVRPLGLRRFDHMLLKVGEVLPERRMDPRLAARWRELTGACGPSDGSAANLLAEVISRLGDRARRRATGGPAASGPCSPAWP